MVGALAFGLLVFMASIYLMSMLKQPVKEQSDKKVSIKDINLKAEMPAYVFIDVLDWAMSHGVVDTQEYNKILAKALPYLKE